MNKSIDVKKNALFSRNSIIVCFVSFLLVACGGGGSGGGTSTPTPAPTPTPPVGSDPDNVSIEGKSTVQVNETVGLVAMLDGSSIGYDFQWTQTSGVEVSMLTAKSQVLSFDVPEAGDYSFSVTARSFDGSDVFEDEFSFTSTSELYPATVRLDHAASETVRVSLRADSNIDSPITAISWQQVSGQNVPASNYIEEDTNPGEISPNLFFFAPTVTQDQLLQFRATMTLANGDNVTDDVYVLVKDVEQNADGFFPGAADRVVTSEMHPYNSDSPYANALESCVYNNVFSSSCQFSTLPLIGQVNSAPTVDDIMDRVYVSHDWMGDRMKDYLENSVASQDMIPLLRGVTAIIISYEVRPSFYWAATGAIYLDAANFWVTPEERDTLNDVPDFRSAFGRDLQFIMPWRYVKDNQSYLSRANYPQAARGSRTFEDVEADITWLMYHELAHANDYFPPDRWASIPNTIDPLNYFRNNPPDSTAFKALFPLQSSELEDLAQVSFAGETATTTQRNYTDIQAADFFSPDAAAMYYSFLNEREDYATLFERFMMAYRFGAEADTAVMIDPDNNPGLLVTWGQRSRINDFKLMARTRHVVRNILPSLDVDAIQPTLPSSKMFRAGESWGQNLILSSERGAGKSASNKAAEKAAINDAQKELADGKIPAYMLHHLGLGKPGIPDVN